MADAPPFDTHTAADGGRLVETLLLFARTLRAADRATPPPPAGGLPAPETPPQAASPSIERRNGPKEYST